MGFYDWMFTLAVCFLVLVVGIGLTYFVAFVVETAKICAYRAHFKKLSMSNNPNEKEKTNG